MLRSCAHALPTCIFPAINVLSPNFAAGAIQVQAFSHFGTSQVVSVQAGRVSPGLFLVLENQHYVNGRHLDGTLVEIRTLSRDS